MDVALCGKLCAHCRQWVISIQPGKGAFDAKVNLEAYMESLVQSIGIRLNSDKETLLQLLEVRKLLEAGVASMCASRADSRDVEAMEEPLAEQERALASGDLELFSIGDLLFHEALVKASQNHILENLYVALSKLMLESRRMTNRLPGVAEESLKAHQEIFLAVRGRDEELAHLAMTKHIDSATVNMRRLISQEHNKSV